MAVNKVEFGDETLIDLTQDTAEADDVAEGKTFHLASGIQAVGTGRGGMSLVNLRGPVASTGNLPASAPSDELWLVGTATPYTGYFYNGTSWESVGTVSVGPPGQDGFSPEISVDAITGGHRVSVTDADGTETFDVMDGEQGGPGATGATGAAAGFGTPTASVDANVGTPSVTITASGPDTAKVFNFAFRNLKGEPGTGGLPTGGSANQFLMKSSSADYAANWVSLYSGEVPLMDGNASAGLSSLLSRRDHVHPTDTSRQAKITASGILKGDGSGGVSAAVAGTDYQTPFKTTTLTIETSEWTNNSVSKTVSGMTATALVFVEFSDTTTDYTVAQSTNTLTFTASAAPSSQITVKVGFLV